MFIMKKPPFNIPECVHPLLLVNPRALYLLDNGGEPHGIKFNLKAVATPRKFLLKVAYNFLSGTEDFSLLSQFFVTRNDFEFEYLFNVCKCGKCDICLYNKKLDIVNRAVFEDQSWSCPAFFFTLTYKPSDLPPSGNLRYKDVQDFFKRLRRRWDRIGLKHNIRYLVAGEYGHDPRFTFRPHYHVILWNNPYKASEMYPDRYDRLKQDIFDAWTHAEPQSFDFGQVQGGASFYVTKYIGKPFIPKGRWIRPFIHMSNRNGGIGRMFIKQSSDYYRANPNKQEFQFLDQDGRFRSVKFGSYLKGVVHPSPSRLVPPAVRDLYRQLTVHLQNWVDWFPDLFEYCHQLAEDARPYKSVLINPIVAHDNRDRDYFRPRCKTFYLWVISCEFETIHSIVHELADQPDVDAKELQMYYDFVNRQVPGVDNRPNLAAKLFRIREKNSLASQKDVL